MTRRGKIRLISYVVALTTVLSAALAACHVGAGRYTTRLDAQSTRAFGEAISAVERLSRSLNLCAYAVDAPMQSALCTQLYADASAAETALSALPVELDALEGISRHISVAGDYAYLLSHTAAEGITFSSVTLEHLAAFSEHAHLLSDKLSELRAAYEQGDLLVEEHGRLTDALDNLESETKQASNTLNEAFHTLAASLPALVPLVYDGQYSDHTEDSAKALAGKPIVSQFAAMEAAAAFLQHDPEALVPLDLAVGELPCWRFSVPENHAVIAVTVKGGQVLRYLSDCTEPGDTDPEKAASIGSKFLSERGFGDMELVETNPGGSVVSLTFAPVADGVLCLPDRVTVKVCSATGRVTAFDASDYLKHHAARSFPDAAPAWTPPNTLSVSAQRKVVLLSPGGQERYCMEYLCSTPKGESVRVFINAETGLQERILIDGDPMQTFD